MRRIATLLVAVAATLVLAAPAAAEPPSDLSTDPLDRGALLALPSVYRVDVTIRVDGLVTSSGQRVAVPPAAREIPESGTAFAVAPGGWLATAAHVVAPDDAGLARLVYQNTLALQRRPHSDAVAADWVERTGARPVGSRIVRRVVRQADAGEGAAGSRAYVPSRVVRSQTADLALMQIDAPGAPALLLDESASIGTPVATIGFGVGGAFAEPARGQLEPAIRRGELGRTGVLEEEDPPRSAIALAVPVQPGDSGGPVVDSSGNVRGVVIIRTEQGGIAERSTEVRQLLATVGAEPGAGRSAELFRGAMGSFWALDLSGAERGFASTLAAFDDHTLARREIARAADLSRADFRLEGDRRVQGFLLALGALAVVAALACGIGLARTTPPPDRRRPRDAGRSAPGGEHSH